MDPISQGVLGAVAALAVAKRDGFRLAALVGWGGGMLADADIFIRSATDPLLNIEYHRHFSHSLAFIPVGGFIAALLFFPLLRKRLSLGKLYLYATAGYATAGLLDACTSYGTQLLWPFSNQRVSWNIISIVDPLYTLVLILLVGLAVFKKSSRNARGAVIYAVLYLGFGTLQNQRASTFQHALLTDRGHHGATQLTVKPSIANLVLWRSLYLHDGHYYVDAIRVGVFAESKAYPGARVAAYDIDPQLESLPYNSRLAHDLSRFEHFSDGYLAALPDEPSFLTDLRYSALPDSSDPLWGLNLAEINDAGHAAFETRRSVSEADRKRFLQMLKGN